MKPTAQIALAMALLAFAVACHKDNKVAQLNALNEAYKSGVFTKEEYAAKWQALTGSPPGAPTAPAQPVEPAPAVNPPAAQPGAAAPPTVAASSPPVAAAPPSVAPSSPPVAAAPPSVAAASPPVAAASPAISASSPPVAAARPPVGAAPLRQSAPPPPPPAQTIPPPSSVPPAPVYPPPSTRQAAPTTPAPAPAAEPAEPEPAPLAGCQDAESRAGGPNAVQERFFPASEDSVRQAALQAFANLDFTVHRSVDHEIEASKKRHLSVLVGAGGERVILHFSIAKKNGQPGTKVTAETKKSFTGKLAQKSWTSAVLAQMTCNMRSR